MKTTATNRPANHGRQGSTGGNRKDRPPPDFSVDVGLSDRYSVQRKIVSSFLFLAQMRRKRDVSDSNPRYFKEEPENPTQGN